MNKLKLVCEKEEVYYFDCKLQLLKQEYFKALDQAKKEFIPLKQAIKELKEVKL